MSACRQIRDEREGRERVKPWFGSNAGREDKEHNTTLVNCSGFPGLSSLGELLVCLDTQLRRGYGLNLFS